MEQGEGKTVVVKNVFKGRNPDTGRPYFERRKIRVTKPEETPPPGVDEVPPLDEEGNVIEGFQKSFDEIINQKKKG